MGVFQDFKEATARKRLLYLVLVFVIMLLLIVGIFFVIQFIVSPELRGPQVIDTDDQVLNQDVVRPVLTTNPISIAEERAAQQQQQDVSIVATPFVERYGSYNNQDQFQNFSEIRIFMTPSLSTYVTNTLISQLQEEVPSFDTFYAINTKVLSSQLVEREESTARMEMSTQRREIGVGGVVQNVYNQDVQVELELINGEWKVDGVFWL
jgi:hypothetical protein